jgi:hypothetical protein
MSSISNINLIHEKTNKYKKMARDGIHLSHTYKKLSQLIEDDLRIAFQMFNLNETSTIEDLRQSYKNAVLKFHPDRPGGNEQTFYIIQKAYHLLSKKFKFESQTDRSVEEIQYSRDEDDGQLRCTIANGKNFNQETFNKIFDETRIYNAHDEGYGDWMKSSVQQDENTYRGDYNRNRFNDHFDKEKQHHEIIRRVDVTGSSAGTSMNYDYLGEDHIDNFSGKCMKLNFTDLKQAHTEKMISTKLHEASRPVYDSVEQLERDRQTQNFQMTREEAHYLEGLKLRDEEMERQRMENVFIRDKIIEKQHVSLQKYFLKSD